VFERTKPPLQIAPAVPNHRLMVGIEPIALSGLNAAQLRLATAAHNIANLAVEPFHRQFVLAQAAAGGGVEVSLSQASRSGADLAGDLVAQRIAAHEVAANLRVLQTADRLIGTLIDTLA
jgi:flagellar hook-associated protein FlgK